MSGVESDSESKNSKKNSEEDLFNKFGLKCFVCGEYTSLFNNVKRFDHEKLIRCEKFLSIRIENEWDYTNVTIPTDIAGFIGYHSNCYSTFIKISGKRKAKKKSESNLITNNESLNDMSNVENTSLDEGRTDFSTKNASFFSDNGEPIEMQEYSRY